MRSLVGHIRKLCFSFKKFCLMKFCLTLDSREQSLTFIFVGTAMFGVCLLALQQFLTRPLSIQSALVHVHPKVDDRDRKTQQHQQENKGIPDLLCGICDRSNRQWSEPAASLVRNRIQTEKLGLSSLRYQIRKH